MRCYAMSDYSFPCHVVPRGKVGMRRSTLRNISNPFLPTCAPTQVWNSASSVAADRSKPTCRIRSGCCARPASGYAIAAPPISVMNSRRLIIAPEGSRRGIVAAQTCIGKGWSREAADVRFGSIAGICSAKCHVRFSLNSGHEMAVCDL